MGAWASPLRPVVVAAIGSVDQQSPQQLGPGARRPGPPRPEGRRWRRARGAAGAALDNQRARASGNRPGPVQLGTGQARRPGPHAQRPAIAACCRRSHPMANRPGPGPAQSRRGRSSGNWQGGMTTGNRKAVGSLGADAASRPHGPRPRRQMNKGMTLAELLALPLMVDVSTAARALGLSRSTGYELARRGDFPCRVLHVGSSYRVPTAELLRVLGIDLSELSPRFPAA